VTGLAWSPDGTLLATTGWDGTLRIWDIESGEMRQGYQTPGPMSSLSWSSDGELLALVPALPDRVVRIWDVFNEQELHTLVGHTDAITDAAWSPDGTALASVSADGTLRVWKLADDD
jgi:WD40 repeat protein